MRWAVRWAGAHQKLEGADSQSRDGALVGSVGNVGTSKLAQSEVKVRALAHHPVHHRRCMLGVGGRERRARFSELVLQRAVGVGGVARGADQDGLCHRPRADRAFDGRVRGGRRGAEEDEPEQAHGVGRRSRRFSAS